jgi:hypothetical protein
MVEMGVSSVEMGGERDGNGTVIRSANDANYRNEATQRRKDARAKSICKA